MLKFLKNEKVKAITIISLNLVFGVLFCVLLGNMMSFVESALCILMFLMGVVCLVIYSFLPNDEKIPKIFFLGIVGVLLGVFILIWPRFFGIALSIIVGYGGVSSIILAAKTKKSKQGIWVTDLVIGIIVCALSVTTIVLSGTNVAKNILAIFFGAICLTQGIYRLVEFIKTNKKPKEKIEEKSEENIEKNEENTETAEN